MGTYVGNTLVAGATFNPTLLDFKWTDHILNDVSWLRADTFSWQPGNVYIAVYQHLANDINGKTLQSETISGTTIQFYLSDDGHKICPDLQESNVETIYTATGVAWYYILDTVNNRFKLPRVNPDVVQYITGVDVYGNGDYLRFMSGSDTSKGSYINSHTESLGSQTGWLRTYNSSGSLVNLGNMKLSDVKGESGIKADITKYFAGKKHLYFYVGNFTKSAIQQTAGITTEELNGKVDVGHQVIAFQVPTSANNYTWYRKYADGWVEQGGQYVGIVGVSTGVSITLPVTMTDANYTLNITGEQNSSNWAGAVIRNGTRTTTGFQAYVWGGGSGDQIRGLCWVVQGMAA